jgi:prevent-host-death family protein
MTRARRATLQGPETSRSSTAGRRSTVGSSMRSSQFTVNATQAKNQFGEILRRVREASPVFIEKHGAPLAVVLDVKSYEALVFRARGAQQTQLDALREEFEAMYARMQEPRSRRAIGRLSTISDDELNSIAARHAKRRG